MSIRSDIIADIKTTLETITVTNGYNNTVKLVSERLKIPDELHADEFPALFIVDSNEVKKDNDVDELKNELSIIITGYVKDSNNPTPVLRTLLDDVEKALSVDRFRGGLAINTLPADIKTDNGTLLPYAVFDFTFNIIYFQKYGTP